MDALAENIKAAEQGEFRELLAEQRRTNALLADMSTRGLPPLNF